MNHHSLAVSRQTVLTLVYYKSIPVHGAGEPHGRFLRLIPESSTGIKTHLWYDSHPHDLLRGERIIAETDLFSE